MNHTQQKTAWTPPPMFPNAPAAHTHTPHPAYCFQGTDVGAAGFHAMQPKAIAPISAISAPAISAPPPGTALPCTPPAAEGVPAAPPRSHTAQEEEQEEMIIEEEQEEMIIDRWPLAPTSDYCRYIEEYGPPITCTATTCTASCAANDTADEGRVSGKAGWRSCAKDGSTLPPGSLNLYSMPLCLGSLNLYDSMPLLRLMTLCLS
jgi:hypothetical protein